MEKYKYFISYESRCGERSEGIYNTEIFRSEIISIDDIREIENDLRIGNNDIVTIINYRMF